MQRKLSKPTLAIIVANMVQEPFQELAQKMANLFEQNGWYVIIYNAAVAIGDPNANPSSRYKIFDLINYPMIDVAVMFATSISNQDIIKQVTESFCNHQIPLIVPEGTHSGPGIYNLQYTYEDAFCDIVEHLVTVHNCKRINMLAGIRGNDFSEQRICAYKKVLEKHGIVPEDERIDYGDFWDTPAKAAVQRMLESKLPFPDAIVCANDAMAMAACEVLNEHDYSIPNDIIVTGLDGIKAEQYHIPRLTTASIHIEEVISTVYQLADRIYHKKECPSLTLLPLNIRYSQSCGCTKAVFSKDANQRMLALHKNFGYLHNFVNFLNDAQIDMANITTDKQMIERVKERFYQMAQLCVVPSFSDDMTTEFPAEIPKQMLRLAYCDTEWKNAVYDPILFSTEMLLPDAEDFLQKSPQMLVTLLNYREQVIGYYCIPAFRSDWINYSQLNHYIIFLQNVLVMEKHAKKMHFLMNRDPLTSLYNRRGFYDYIENAQANLGKGRHSLILHSIDLDDLKSINDTYGHKEGDFTIHAIAEAMSNAIKSLGDQAICARFGGDEYVAACITTDNAEEISEDIRKKFEENVAYFNQYSQKPYILHASMGTVIVDFTKDTNIDIPLSAADKKMYAQKQLYKRS